MLVKIVNTSNNPLPKYETSGSAGMDVRAFLEEDITIAPHERKLVPTGLYVSLPKGYEMQIRARSGLAYKKGLILPNAPGTVDSDFRGHVHVILANISTETHTIKNGDRIAQLVFAKYEQVTWEEVEVLDETERGEGGFGSTGV